MCLSCFYNRILDLFDLSKSLLLLDETKFNLEQRVFKMPTLNQN